MSFASLTFLAPWALAAALALPILWWLLRVTPPAPRQIRFPAIRLLLGLGAREETPAKTPLWLVLLRMLAAVLIILGVAHPVLDARPNAGDERPLLLVVDDGWASAADWSTRRARIEALLDEADRLGREVTLLTTAPPADGREIRATRPMTPDQARSAVQALAPKPWPVDREAAEQAARQLPRNGRAMRVVWLTDGLETEGVAPLARRLQTLGAVEAFVPPSAALPRQLLPPQRATDGIAPVIRRATAGRDEQVTLRVLDAGGHVLARQDVALPAGEGEVAAALDIPAELRNRAARVDLVQGMTAGSVVLLDDAWRRRPVGLVTAAQEPGTPLLDPLHYVEKALSPYAEIRRGGLDDLLRRPLAVAVLPENASLSAEERDELERWVLAGGLLLRFAGPNLATKPDDLLPVRLRQGGRRLGGALSWTEPMGLAAFPRTGPFRGLSVPEDVRIEAQVLAEPELGLDEKTWARLEDGTPLLTADQRGKGWLILVHTTATPAWGNLAMSGLFVDMLRRIVMLSEGVGLPGDGDAPLPPIEILDAYGAPQPPGALAAAIKPGENALPGPQHPPGFYGTETARHALNLAPALQPPRPLSLPRGVVLRSYERVSHALDLRPWLLAGALLLAVIDMAVALGLRGVLSRRKTAAAAAGTVFVLLTGPAPDAVAQEDLAFAMDAALTARLAYVEAGEPSVDEVSRAGLIGLTNILGNRTAAELGEPMAVDIEEDPLVFFPLLYWPISSAQGPLSEEAQAKVNEYLRNGGMILFDTRDQDAAALGADGPESLRFREMASQLAIPPLMPVTEEHVLTRSFYLLRELPGRFAGGTVWVERGGDSTNDGVSPVIIGGHDWAGAWAVDSSGRPMFATVPGGEQQREMAYRFGVNVVMYALTGNYKGDQVHLPAILERLGE